MGCSAKSNLFWWPDVCRRSSKLGCVKVKGFPIGVHESRVLFSTALCRHVVQWAAKGFLERTPVVSCVGQVQVPGLVDFVTWRDDAGGNPAQIGEFLVLDDDFLRVGQ